MNDGRDYISYPLYVAAIVIAILAVVSLFPPARVGGVTLKRTNILSDVITWNDSLFYASLDAQDDADSLFIVPEDTLPAPVQPEKIITENWNIAPKPVATPRPETAQAGRKAQVKIEDFGDPSEMASFYRTLAEGKRDGPIRIAFLGDSFIEGDIIVGDVREQLQDIYGGAGVGFLTLSQGLYKYRPSVKQGFTGWKDWNMISKDKAPEELRERFFISGILSTPDEGAVSKYEGTAFRRYLDSFSSARIIFVNRENSRIAVTVNDSIHRQFTPASSVDIQEIGVRGNIASIAISVSQVQGFTGYGIVLDDDSGVSVDNFSMRSNSGLSLTASSRAVNLRLDKLLDYDLIVLQYGLNAMTADRVDYTAYGQRMEKIVAYVKSCFPDASLLLMSVGDRATQQEGQFVTMPGIPAMVNVQRRTAENTGIAFWNTYRAMGGENSMPGFVERNWAAKDYTHLSYGGGKFIAGKLVAALLAGRDEYKAAEAAPQEEETQDETL